MRVGIRVNASSDIGLGHVMRCMTLAEMLQKWCRAKIHFWINDDAPATIVDDLSARGFKVIFIPGEASASLYERSADRIQDQASKQIYDAWACIAGLQGVDELELIVVDHYELGEQWEIQLLPSCRKLMVIDDLANRRHCCHILLDQNLAPDMELRYQGLVPETCVKLLGPAYTLLRSSFFEYRSEVRFRHDCCHILVNFGGSDPTNETEKVIAAIRSGGSRFDHIRFSIVAGQANIRQQEIAKMCQPLDHVTYYSRHNDMAGLLASVDVAIGAGGISLWERAFMGVPALVVSVAANQTEAVLEAERLGMVWHLGASEVVSEGTVLSALEQLLNDRTQIKEKSLKCLEVMQPLINKGIHPILSVIEKNA
ncbi:UDP-2,4-diacetamido-2,4,6-trideoxy-beta-L-altropyranose hydrolase [Paenibacillus sp. IITD108]|uniref:UDP-2,4-diacetamido-2,4, 6-trideoxy-beta-L-altropyranose hydrolase n=1 Tax=Paenibacillus sp. IITD108 TaxID=3116649 RepID=UPI002F4132C1